ncbi:MAG: hypothetical protein IJ088_10525 [Clostridia bacterium]|nr:hypothetical protein [Clostridia bacterium]
MLKSQATGKEWAKAAPVCQILFNINHTVPKAKATGKEWAKAAPVCQILFHINHTVPKAKATGKEYFSWRCALS